MRARNLIVLLVLMFATLLTQPANAQTTQKRLTATKVEKPTPAVSDSLTHAIRTPDPDYPLQYYWYNKAGCRIHAPVQPGVPVDFIVEQGGRKFKLVMRFDAWSDDDFSPRAEYHRDMFRLESDPIVRTCGPMLAEIEKAGDRYVARALKAALPKQ